jgi:hypothetical protein
MSSLINIDSIYADGYCLVGPNSYGYARITDKNRNSLVHYFEEPDLVTTQITTPLGQVKCVQVRSEDTPQQQIQYAEITALYMALKVALMLKIPIVYTDSITANAWSSGRINCKINDQRKLKMCTDTQILRKQYEQTGFKILMIEGKNNPADFGYHNLPSRSNKTLYINNVSHENKNGTNKEFNLDYIDPPENNGEPENKDNKLNSMKYIKLCADAYDFYYLKLLNGLKGNNIKLNPTLVIGFIISNSDINKNKYGWNIDDLYYQLVDKIKNNTLEIEQNLHNIIKELTNIELRLKINLLEPRVQNKLVILAIENLKRNNDDIDDSSNYMKITEHIESYLQTELENYKNLNNQNLN